MSKAFTRESDNNGPDETPWVRRQIPAGTKNLVTRQGADRLRLKLESLMQERQALATKSAEIDGEERTQRQRIDSAIRNLQEVLSSIVIAELPIDQSKVGFGAAVTVMYPDGHQETFRIVGVEEADPDGGSISWLSPLAKALLSKRAGDHVPSGTAGEAPPLWPRLRLVDPSNARLENASTARRIADVMLQTRPCRQLRIDPFHSSRRLVFCRDRIEHGAQPGGCNEERNTSVWGGIHVGLSLGRYFSLGYSKIIPLDFPPSWWRTDSARSSMKRLISCTPG